MKKIDLLKEQKKLLYLELKNCTSPTRKEEIIDQILKIEQRILRLLWEIPSQVSNLQYSLK